MAALESMAGRQNPEWGFVINALERLSGHPYSRTRVKGTSMAGFRSAAPSNLIITGRYILQPGNDYDANVVMLSLRLQY